MQEHRVHLGVGCIGAEELAMEEQKENTPYRTADAMEPA